MLQGTGDLIKVISMFSILKVMLQKGILYLFSPYLIYVVKEIFAEATQRD